MIALLDYDAGNVKSVQNALDRLGTEYVLTDDIEILNTAEKIIFPGVGHAGAAMKSLQKKGLDVFLKNTQQPVLGICVGMQLLYDQSEEGDTECLGIIPGTVTRFAEAKVGKVPHINWCEVEFLENPSQSPLVRGEVVSKSPLEQGELSKIREDALGHKGDLGGFFYFVHSYYATINQFTVAVAQYGSTEFTAMVQKDNFIGTQFHPEKSGDAGAIILETFLNS